MLEPDSDRVRIVDQIDKAGHCVALRGFAPALWLSIVDGSFFEPSKSSQSPLQTLDSATGFRTPRIGNSLRRRSEEMKRPQSE